MSCQFPGGGKNDRKAARLEPNGQWKRCEFEELRLHDCALIFEADGTAVASECGGFVQIVMEAPEQSEDGKWHFLSACARCLGNYDPNTKATHP